jgi:hypothetical protein
MIYCGGGVLSGAHPVQYCKIYTGRKLKIAHHQIYIMCGEGGGGDKAHKNNNVPMYVEHK